MNHQMKLNTSEELLEILEQLRALKKRFNQRTTPCTCCGLVQYENREEYQAAIQLNGAIGRVDKVVSILASHES